MKQGGSVHIILNRSRHWSISWAT